MHSRNSNSVSRVVTRSKYTWYMSGETKQREDDKYTAGVAIVIDNKFAKYVEDIIPHTDRIIQLTLKGTCKINIFSIYLPPATTTNSIQKNWTEFKEKVYKKLEESQRELKTAGIENKKLEQIITKANLEKTEQSSARLGNIGRGQAILDKTRQP